MSVIDEQTQTQQDNTSYQCFEIFNEDSFSHFRIQMTGNNLNENSSYYLKYFDLFGANPIVNKPTSRGNTTLTDKTHISFPFQSPGHNGLIDFISQLSAEEFFDNFDFEDNKTNDNSSVFNLLTWDNSCWVSEDKLISTLSLDMGNNGWSFAPTGIRIRTGERYFPLCFKLLGYLPLDKRWIPILTISDAKNLCKKFSEKSFQIRVAKSFSWFSLEQTGTNSENSWHFSLSSFELFGELTKHKINN